MFTQLNEIIEEIWGHRILGYFLVIFYENSKAVWRSNRFNNIVTAFKKILLDWLISTFYYS